MVLYFHSPNSHSWLGALLKKSAGTAVPLPLIYLYTREFRYPGAKGHVRDTRIIVGCCCLKPPSAAFSLVIAVSRKTKTTNLSNHVLLSRGFETPRILTSMKQRHAFAAFTYREYATRITFAVWGPLIICIWWWIQISQSLYEGTESIHQV
jgi:hypothetical protein